MTSPQATLPGKPDQMTPIRAADPTKLIGYARVSTRQQSTDRQETDLLAAGDRRDDLYVDHGFSGARASRPQFDQALGALIEGDTLVITTLDRLGRSTQNMLAFAEELRGRGSGLRVLNLGGGDVDTSTPMGSMLFTIMAALAQMEHEIKSERITDSISKRRAAGKDLGCRHQRTTDSQIRSASASSKGARQPPRSLATSACLGRRSTEGLKPFSTKRPARPQPTQSGNRTPPNRGQVQPVRYSWAHLLNLYEMRHPEKRYIYRRSKFELAISAWGKSSEFGHIVPNSRRRRPDPPNYLELLDVVDVRGLGIARNPTHFLLAKPDGNIEIVSPPMENRSLHGSRVDPGLELFYQYCFPTSRRK